MDAGIIKTLKHFYRRSILVGRIFAFDSGAIYHLNLLQALRLIQRAWDAVSPVTIKNCFKHCGFSINSTQSDDWGDLAIEDDSPQLLARLSDTLSMPPEIDFDFFVSADDDVVVSATQSDSDIVGDILARSNPSDESDEEEEPDSYAPTSPPPTLSDAHQALQVLSRFHDSRASIPSKMMATFGAYEEMLQHHCVASMHQVPYS